MSGASLEVLMQDSDLGVSRQHLMNDVDSNSLGLFEQQDEQIVVDDRSDTGMDEWQSATSSPAVEEESDSSSEEESDEDLPVASSSSSLSDVRDVETFASRASSAAAEYERGRTASRKEREGKSKKRGPGRPPKKKTRFPLVPMGSGASSPVMPRTPQQFMPAHQTHFSSQQQQLLPPKKMMFSAMDVTSALQQQQQQQQQFLMKQQQQQQQQQAQQIFMRPVSVPDIVIVEPSASSSSFGGAVVNSISLPVVPMGKKPTSSAVVIPAAGAKIEQLARANSEDFYGGGGGGDSPNTPRKRGRPPKHNMMVLGGNTLVVSSAGVARNNNGGAMPSIHISEPVDNNGVDGGSSSSSSSMISMASDPSSLNIPNSSAATPNTSTRNSPVHSPQISAHATSSHSSSNANQNEGVAVISVRSIPCFYEHCTYSYKRPSSSIVEVSDRPLILPPKFEGYTMRACKKHHDRWKNMEHSKQAVCEICRGLNCDFDPSTVSLQTNNKGIQFALCSVCVDRQAWMMGMPLTNTSKIPPFLETSNGKLCKFIVDNSRSRSPSPKPARVENDSGSSDEFEPASSLSSSAPMQQQSQHRDHHHHHHHHDQLHKLKKAASQPAIPPSHAKNSARQFLAAPHANNTVSVNSPFGLASNNAASNGVPQQRLGFSKTTSDSDGEHETYAQQLLRERRQQNGVVVAMETEETSDNDGLGNDGADEDYQEGGAKGQQSKQQRPRKHYKAAKPAPSSSANSTMSSGPSSSSSSSSSAGGVLLPRVYTLHRSSAASVTGWAAHQASAGVTYTSAPLWGEFTLAVGNDVPCRIELAPADQPTPFRLSIRSVLMNPQPQHQVQPQAIPGSMIDYANGVQVQQPQPLQASSLVSCLFADTEIVSGTVIGEFVGKVCEIKNPAVQKPFCLALNERLEMDASAFGNETRFIRRSLSHHQQQQHPHERPNVKFELVNGHVLVLTTRAILPNEELTAVYSICMPATSGVNSSVSGKVAAGASSSNNSPASAAAQKSPRDHLKRANSTPTTVTTPSVSSPSTATATTGSIHHSMYSSGGHGAHHRQPEFYLETFQLIAAYNREILSADEQQNSAFDWFTTEGFGVLEQRGKITVPIEKRFPMKKGLANTFKSVRSTGSSHAASSAAASFTGGPNSKDPEEWGYVAQLEKLDLVRAREDCWVTFKPGKMWNYDAFKYALSVWLENPNAVIVSSPQSQHQQQQQQQQAVCDPNVMMIDTNSATSGAPQPQQQQQMMKAAAVAGAGAGAGAFNPMMMGPQTNRNFFAKSGSKDKLTNFGNNVGAKPRPTQQQHNFAASRFQQQAQQPFAGGDQLSQDGSHMMMQQHMLQFKQQNAAAFTPQYRKIDSFLHNSSPYENQLLLYSLQKRDFHGQNLGDHVMAGGEHTNGLCNFDCLPEISCSELKMKLDKESILTQGMNGSTVKGYWNGFPVAVRFPKHEPRAAPSTADRAHFFRQCAAMFGVTHHPNILSVHGLCDMSTAANQSEVFVQSVWGTPEDSANDTPSGVQDQQNAASSSLASPAKPANAELPKTACMLVIEHMNLGSLKNWLARAPVHVQAMHIPRIALDVARAMEFIHSKGMLHNSLKTRNVLLKGELLDQCMIAGLEVKLAEVGATSHESTLTYIPTHEDALFLAPEILQQKKFSAASDVYAFGMLLCHLFSEGAANPKDPVECQVTSRILNSWDRRWKELITRCTNENPNMRPSFRDVMTMLMELQHSGHAMDE